MRELIIGPAISAAATATVFAGIDYFAGGGGAIGDAAIGGAIIGGMAYVGRNMVQGWKTATAFTLALIAVSLVPLNNAINTWAPSYITNTAAAALAEDNIADGLESPEEAIRDVAIKRLRTGVGIECMTNTELADYQQRLATAVTGAVATAAAPTPTPIPGARPAATATPAATSVAATLPVSGDKRADCDIIRDPAQAVNHLMTNEVEAIKYYYSPEVKALRHVVVLDKSLNDLAGNDFTAEDIANHLGVTVADLVTLSETGYSLPPGVTEDKTAINGRLDKHHPNIKNGDTTIEEAFLARLELMVQPRYKDNLFRREMLSARFGDALGLRVSNFTQGVLDASNTLTANTPGIVQAAQDLSTKAGSWTRDNLVDPLRGRP